MSSAVALPVATASSHPGYFLLRRLQSLTGILFGLYLCVHLLVNATLIQGRNPDVFQAQVNKIHDLPFLLMIEMSLIFAPIVVHALFGIYIMTNGRPNVGSYPHIKNWFYLLQRVSAVALLAFIFFHVGGMYGWFGEWLTFDKDRAFDSTVRHVQANPFLYLIVYPLGVIAGTFHLANGFWTAAIAWGLTVSKEAQNRWGWVCLGLFLFTTACGFTALVATFIHKKAAFAAVAGAQ
ncbi:MAG: hypothetical protein H7144_03580 [Burkholderiales bacterium]|nr:hypothetical protein [Phycisphaerae bacterium]